MPPINLSQSSMPLDEWGQIEARLDAEKEPDAIEVPGKPVIEEADGDPPILTAVPKQEELDDDPGEVDEEPTDQGDASSTPPDIDKLVAERVAEATKELQANQKTESEQALIQMITEDPQFLQHVMGYLQPGQGSPQQSAQPQAQPQEQQDPFADIEDPEEREAMQNIVNASAQTAVQQVLQAISPYLQQIQSFQPHIAQMEDQSEFKALDEAFPGWDKVMSRDDLLKHRAGIRKDVGRSVPALTAFKLVATPEQLRKIAIQKEEAEPQGNQRQVDETWGRPASPRRPTRKRPSTESRAPLNKQQMFLKAYRDVTKKLGG